MKTETGKYLDWSIKDLEKTKGSNGLKVFSCFACGGGSSMGYKLAGYDIVGVNEIDPQLVAMYKANFPDVKHVISLPIQEMVKQGQYPQELMDIDVLDGSPPCSSFSMAGNRESDWGVNKKFREGQSEQVLDDLFFWFIKLAADIRPKVVISENVVGMVSGKAKGYVAKVFKEFEKIGYRTQLFRLNSASMGVPQKRERVFFISVRKDFSDKKLMMAFSQPPIFYKDIKTNDGINKELTAMEKELFESILPSDRNLSDINNRVRGKNIGFTMHILSDHQVSNTLSSGGAMYSFTEKRHLTTGELIRIQSFPKDYNFVNNQSYNHIKYVLGMSVPPLMMKGVATAVARQVFGV